MISTASTAFLPARPVTPADLLALTERVRTSFVRWFLRHGLLDAEAAADMLAWQNSGFSDRIRYTLPRHKRGQWVGPGPRPLEAGLRAG